MIGKTLSHYKVLEELSRGGMGIVYRALDVKLDREVALKVLPPELVAEPERKRRFIQEAKAAAKLNHPHIGMVHEIDEAEGVTFIAMELIRGEQLKDIINRERLPLARSLELATEVAEGLSRAHDKGIIHRDLKPANIMVTEDGHAKIIDFGLAKLVEPLAGGGSDVETMLRRETDPGKVMGTVSYMSPEQARGKKVDHRSDIFSFGILLFEMLTGHIPFEASSGIDTLNAILNKPAPPLPTLDTASIAATSVLQRIVHRCLDKDPEDRYQTAKDLLSELRRAKRESDSDISMTTSEAPALEPTRTVRRWHFAAAAVLSVLLVTLVVYLLLPEKEAVLRLTNPVQVTTHVARETWPSLSPDGQTVAYVSNQDGDWDIWVQQIGSSQAVNRTPDHDGIDGGPSWSPDGRQIAFWSNRDGGEIELFVMPAIGGIARKVASRLSARAYQGAPQWSVDGTQLAFAARDTTGPVVEIVSVDTSESRKLPLPGRPGNERLHLSWSPDGRYFAYVDAISTSAEVTQIWILRVVDEETFSVTDGRMNDWNPSWSSDGSVLYYVSNRGGSMDLWMQSIEEDGKPSGESQRLTTGIGMRLAVFSPDGSKLIYSRGGRQYNIWRMPIPTDRPLAWADAQQLTFEQAFLQFLDLSPDGQWLFFSSDRSGNQDLWKMPAIGGEMQQLTTEPTPDWSPRLSPDGTQIAFYSYRSGNRDVWVMPVDGGLARQLTRHDAADWWPAWSPNGQMLAFVSARSGSSTLWVVPAEGGQARQLTDQPGGDFSPTWSPDGKWVFFYSDRTGKERLWRVSTEGGEPEPVTRGSAVSPVTVSLDGTRVFYDRERNIWAVSLEDGTEYPVTDLSGRRGWLGDGSATDGEYLYFPWGEVISDLWVMDVVHE